MLISPEYERIKLVYTNISIFINRFLNQHCYASEIELPNTLGSLSCIWDHVK